MKVAGLKMGSDAIPDRLPVRMFTVCNALQCHLILIAAQTQSIENELA